MALAVVKWVFGDNEKIPGWRSRMTMTPSTMLELGTRLPSFQLFDVHGNLVSSKDIPNENGALIVFLCPHCPYVRHIRKDFSKFAQEYRAKGLPIVAINSNDNIAFPDDAPEGMLKEISQAGYTFPYLIDETQEVAKAFRAACTPDFFLFDRDLKLVYRGQFDSSRPSNPIPITGSDLRAAADAVLTGNVPSLEQRPSMGCNIKWKVGNEPEYFAVPVRSR
jgi:thiol-disulfide isomerase/thioredoxin